MSGNPLNLVKGLGVTLRTMFRRPVTVSYPEHKRPVSARFRGRHELKRYANGLERCIGCSLCSAACPADAIFVVPAENREDERYSPGERYAEVYEINMLRCIFCGYCEEACPVDAIVLEKEYELAAYDRREMVYTKEMLLVPPGPEGQATPQDTRGQEVPFRMGGMDYFQLPAALRAPSAAAGAPGATAALPRPAHADLGPEAPPSGAAAGETAGEAAGEDAVRP